MAHELETIDGKTSFASVRLPAWHGLGTILPDYVSGDVMLKTAGLEWEVLFGEVYDADMCAIEGYRRTYRSDNGKNLGIVGGRYHIAQNSRLMESAEAFSSIGRDYGISFGLETAGVLYGGKKVFITATFDRSLYVGGEEVTKNLVLTTSHDGTGATRVFLSPTRVVCQNTLTLALNNTQRSFAIRHTESAERKLATVGAQLKLMRVYFEGFEAKANELLNQAFPRNQFEELVKELIPIKDDEESKRAKTLALNAREELSECRMARDLDDVRNTAWGAFNACVDYSDHYSGTRGKDKDSRLFERTFTDSDFKDMALNLILAKA